MKKWGVFEWIAASLGGPTFLYLGAVLSLFLYSLAYPISGSHAGTMGLAFIVPATFLAWLAYGTSRYNRWVRAFLQIPIAMFVTYILLLDILGKLEIDSFLFWIIGRMD